MKPHTAQKRNTRKLRNVGNRHGGSSAVTVGILGVAPIKIPDFDTEETARTQERSASGSTQESSAPGPQLAGSMSRTRTWVSVGVDAGFSELLETSPPSSLTLATSGSFSPRNSGTPLLPSARAGGLSQHPPADHFLSVLVTKILQVSRSEW